MSEDTSEATGERAKMSMRRRRNVDSMGSLTGQKKEMCKCDAYRDGNARGELRRAVALSTVCKM